MTRFGSSVREMFLGFLLGTLILGGLAVAQAPVPVAPVAPAAPNTLWHFLGIPQTYHCLHDNCANKFGFFPCLESKPKLKKLADPANLLSPNPAIAAAAKVKAQEDLAPQKIKAIRYLAKIGCGCYNKDKSITKALVAAMEDCTEAVRLAAVEAIGSAAESDYCVSCGEKSCCSPEVTEALVKIAYEKNDEGCPLEPSERVREAAVRAIRACCPGGYPMTEEIIENPERPERPTDLPPPLPEPTPVDPAAPVVPILPVVPANPPGGLPSVIPGPAPPRGTPGPGTKAAPKAKSTLTSREPASPQEAFTWLEDQDQPAKKVAARTVSSRQTSPGPAVIGVDKNGVPVTSSRRKHQATPVSQSTTQEEPKAAPSREVAATAIERLPEVSEEPARGQTPPALLASARLAPIPAQPRGSSVRSQIESVDGRQGLVYLVVTDRENYRVGETVGVFHNYLTGRAKVGDLEIIHASEGHAVARPTGQTKIARVSRGDDVLVIR